MAKSTVIPFELPSEFSPDPLTEVIKNGAKALLHTAIQAEVSSFIAEHAHLLDEVDRQRLVRHGFLPERKVMTEIGTVPVQVDRTLYQQPLGIMALLLPVTQYARSPTHSFTPVFRSARLSARPQPT